MKHGKYIRRARAPFEPIANSLSELIKEQNQIIRDLEEKKENPPKRKNVWERLKNLFK